jgi:hypothetical protein
MKLGVVILPTTTAVMQAEKALLKAGFEIKIVPTPREFSTDCGIAIRFDWKNVEKIRQTLASQAIVISAIHPLEDSKK